MHKVFFYTILLFLVPMFQSRADDSGLQIDRKALVQRHRPAVFEINNLSPFTVGNGNFAFTPDVTGLQTFPQAYQDGIPLATLSNWGWHSIPNTHNFQMRETYTLYTVKERQVPYAADMNSPAAMYLRSNPHRLNLGRISFQHADGSAEIVPTELSQINQFLDLWSGTIRSHFVFAGQQMQALTCVHPSQDLIALQLQAENIAEAHLAIGFAFPYGSSEWGGDGADWQHPEKHHTQIILQNSHAVFLERQVDSTKYYVRIQWQGSAHLIQTDAHQFMLKINAKKQFYLTCEFSPINIEKTPFTKDAFKDCTAYWEKFWQHGGVIDFSQCRDPRAAELERRIVLSQYLLAIQCSGALPPQETGLTMNSWYGKFHMEMLWWHAVHFALWSHHEFLHDKLQFYRNILAQARAKACLQGYQGARWPKMTAPDGFDSPSTIGVFLIWQQPHPIYFAELLYRQHRTPKFLDKYKELVWQAANFMADYVQWNDLTGNYELAAPLIPAQEIYKPEDTLNPTFELAYWRYALQIAQIWRQRLGMPENPQWQHVLDHLSPLPHKNGFYQNAENALDTFSNPENRHDHPTLLAAFGMLPNENIDMAMMQRTLEKVLESWDWQQTWGWDFPMVAMTAARVGLPDLALQALFMDVEKNTYLNNGHNYQSARLPIYLPGNGALLTAVAMMAAGWTDSPNREAPGFPQDGNWHILFENIYKLP